MKMHLPDSIRTHNGYAPRPQTHDFRIIRLTGPRGGDLGYAIALPYGSISVCQQGESHRSNAYRESQLQNLVLSYAENGWLTDYHEAERLSEIHAEARKAFKPTTGDQSSRTQARLAAANEAVAFAKRRIESGKSYFI